MVVNNLFTRVTTLPALKHITHMHFQKSGVTDCIMPVRFTRTDCLNSKFMLSLVYFGDPSSSTHRYFWDHL